MQLYAGFIDSEKKKWFVTCPHENECISTRFAKCFSTLLSRAKAPSTLIRFQIKTDIYLSFGLPSTLKRWKTEILSLKTGVFEKALQSGDFWKRRFVLLVWKDENEGFQKLWRHEYDCACFPRQDIQYGRRAEDRSSQPYILITCLQLNIAWIDLQSNILSKTGAIRACVLNSVIVWESKSILCSRFHPLVWTVENAGVDAKLFIHFRGDRNGGIRKRISVDEA